MILRLMLLLSAACAVFSSSTLALTDPPAVIKADLQIHPRSIIQPFSGEVRFIGEPGYDSPCSVTVNLTCNKRVTDTLSFRLETVDAYGLGISPDSAVWKTPIDSGATFKASFAFRPDQVGTYRLTFSRRLKSSWLPLASLVLALDEDGKAVYAGAGANYRLTDVPPHPQVNDQPLTLRYPLRGKQYDPLIDRHFTCELKFSRKPAVNETTFVDLALECRADKYTKVQFILDYSLNLRPSELPRSWGSSIQLTDSTRFYTGRFSIVPNRAGIGALNLRVVGVKSTNEKSARFTTEFPVFFVMGDDSKLLFVGTFEPWTRYKSKTDVMLGGMAPLLDVKNRDYDFKQVVSKPDYQGDESAIPVDSGAGGKK